MPTYYVEVAGRCNLIEALDKRQARSVLLDDFGRYDVDSAEIHRATPDEIAWVRAMQGDPEARGKGA